MPSLEYFLNLYDFWSTFMIIAQKRSKKPKALRTFNTFSLEIAISKFWSTICGNESYTQRLSGLRFCIISCPSRHLVYFRLVTILLPGLTFKFITRRSFFSLFILRWNLELKDKHQVILSIVLLSSKSRLARSVREQWHIHRN